MNSQTINKKGFTIIEVVLVLAIAGLIFLMVFLALPALQRSQRDTARKNDMSRLAAALNDYKAAHRGKIPGTSTNWQQMIDDYLLGGSTDNSRGSFIDPSGPSSQAPGNQDRSYVLVEKTDQTLSGSFDPSTQNAIFYTVGARCKEGGSEVELGQGKRVVAFRMKLENAGWHCVDN